MIATVPVAQPLRLRSTPAAAASVGAPRQQGPSDVLTAHSPAAAPSETSASSSSRSRAARILIGAAAGAAYGAAVGSGTALAYAAAGLSTGTMIHMGLIVAGGAVNAPLLGKLLESKVERPTNFVLGGMIGAGVTWGTSAFGLMGSPVIGAVAGGLAGAFYGGLAGAIS